MTECERLIKKHFISDSFLEPEEQFGFLVSEKRKKVWAIELDLLAHFSSFCEKHKLKWFLIGGSLLGAVRHKGIIPWDDDIDVGMPRKDYDMFLEISKNAFEYPYFLQTPYSDPGYAYSYVRLRNTNTSCIVPMFQYQGFNHGICIDIFPYENWQIEGGEERYKRIQKLAYDNSTYMRLTNPELDENNRERVMKWPGRNYIEVYEEIQNIASLFKNSPTGKIAKVVFSFNLENEIHDAIDYKDTFFTKFCNIEARIPKGFDNILNIYFGKDYMDIPSPEQRWAHNGAQFDPDNSYKLYLKM